MSSSQPLDGYWLVEMPKDTIFAVYRDPDFEYGRKLRSQATTVRGFSFPAFLCGADKNEICFMPFDALQGRTWTPFKHGSCYYIANTKDITHIRPLVIGESRSIKAYLRKIKLLPDTPFTRMLEKATLRRRDPNTWAEVGGMPSSNL